MRHKEEYEYHVDSIVLREHLAIFEKDGYKIKSHTP